MEQKVKTFPKQITEGDYLFGIDDLALFLRVCCTTARRLHQEGKFPKYRRGRKLMFKKAEVLSGLMEANKQ